LLQQNVGLKRGVEATKKSFVVPNFIAVTKPFFPCKQSQNIRHYSKKTVLNSGATKVKPFDLKNFHYTLSFSYYRPQNKQFIGIENDA